MSTNFGCADKKAPAVGVPKAGLVPAGFDPRFFAWPLTNEPNSPYPGLEALESVDIVQGCQ
jgi:hypothetical protein